MPMNPSAFSLVTCLASFACHKENNAVLDDLCVRIPPDRRELARVSWQHALDRVERAAVTHNCDFNAIIQRPLTRRRSHGETSSISIKCSRNAAILTFDQSVVGSASRIRTISWMYRKPPGRACSAPLLLLGLSCVGYDWRSLIRSCTERGANKYRSRRDPGGNDGSSDKAVGRHFQTPH